MRQRPKHLHRGIHRKPTENYSFAEADDRLRDVLSNHGFADVSHELRHQLLRYYFLLMSEQKIQNFTRLLTLRETGLKHFVDCLIVPKMVRFQFPLLDIGTGPGLPGIVLKLVYPNDKIILAEGVQKRVEFLKKVRSELELKELDIIGRNINRTFVYPIRGAITRAVEDISATLEGVSNALQLGGEVYFMKGPAVGPEVGDALKKWGHVYELVTDKPYQLPHSPHERRLVVFRKHTHPEPIDLEDIINDQDWSDDDN